jgi:hypothetical protein
LAGAFLSLGFIPFFAFLGASFLRRMCHSPPPAHPGASRCATGEHAEMRGGRRMIQRRGREFDEGTREAEE